MNNHSPPLTFKRFQAIVNRLELPRKPLPTITQEQMARCQMQISENHDERYGVPSLEELGFKIQGDSPHVWKGGETEALERLNKHLDGKVRHVDT